ncbi:MAG: B12-binding domain-containing radical SAM protein [Anaerolineae bacterium]|nr:B12-binding domain-containing radical SAM protein [Anaerolineae bacterium]
MTDILFGQSYFLKFDPKLYAAMMPYPPLGTLFAASWMREAGYNVALFDAMLAESEAAWAAALAHHQPRYAVLFEDNFNYLSKMCLLNMRKAAFSMIQMAQAHGIPVIICGADATDHYACYLEAGADYVLRGEGEMTLRELLAALEAGQPQAALEQIAGLAFRSAAGETRVTPPRPIIKQLDELPMPAWDLVDAPRYRAIWQERHGYYSVNMVTTRGCPYHCNWCAKPIWGQRYNVRSPEAIVAEMRWLREHLQPDHIWFADDIFGLKPGWVQRLAALLDQEGWHLPFKCLSRADLLLEQDNIQALRRAGAQIIWIGAESGSQKILDAMDKGTQVAQIYHATQQLKATGIAVGFFLQFGYPGETRADIQKTLAMVRDLLPDDIGISVSYPLPGTRFYERVRQDLDTKANWEDSADLAMLYQGPFPTAFYRQLHRVVHKDYRSRKTWHALRTGRLLPWQASNLRKLGAMLYHRLTLPLAQARLDRLARGTHQATHLAPAES